MKVEKQTVKHIADLARIEMSEDEIEEFAPQLSSIFDYVEQVNELKLDGVEPMYNVHGSKDLEDEDLSRVFAHRDKIIANFPAAEGRFIKIRKVI